MDLYTSLLDAVRTEYDTVRLLKQSERGAVAVVRHRASGVRCVLRLYRGSGEGSARWGLISRVAVHLDIKPDNVLLRGGDAVLIDFDAARLYKSELENDTQVLGTTGYAAPEQYGLTQSDSRADIYALGILLNILLTGQHPSRQLAAGRLGRIVQRCTMVAPSKRYKTVLHLMDAL